MFVCVCVCVCARARVCVCACMCVRVCVRKCGRTVNAQCSARENVKNHARQLSAQLEQHRVCTPLEKPRKGRPQRHQDRRRRQHRSRAEERWKRQREQRKSHGVESKRRHKRCFEPAPKDRVCDGATRKVATELEHSVEEAAHGSNAGAGHDLGYHSWVNGKER
jgi:hypothetical protein